MKPITSIFDLESLARKRLPAVIFDYVRGGSEQELTLRRNLDDMRALELFEQELSDCMSLIGIRDVRKVDPGTVTAQPRL